MCWGIVFCSYALLLYIDFGRMYSNFRSLEMSLSSTFFLFSVEDLLTYSTHKYFTTIYYFIVSIVLWVAIPALSFANINNAMVTLGELKKNIARIKYDKMLESVITEDQINEYNKKKTLAQNLVMIYNEIKKFCRFLSKFCKKSYNFFRFDKKIDQGRLDECNKSMIDFQNYRNEKREQLAVVDSQYIHYFKIEKSSHTEIDINLSINWINSNNKQNDLKYKTYDKEQD